MITPDEMGSVVNRLMPGNKSTHEATIALLVGGDDATADDLRATVRPMRVGLVQVSATSALEIVYARPPSLVLVDDRLEDLPAAALMRQLAATRPNLPIATLSQILGPAGSAEGARETLAAMLGRSPAPGDHDAVAMDIERLRFVRTYGSLLQRGTKARELEQAVLRAARDEAAVLITGETGTGRKTVARAIHYLSARSARPWVLVGRPSLGPTGLDHELFVGVERARGGTLVLEEIDDLGQRFPGKLVSLLRNAGVRLIATGNESLSIGVGKLRRDLPHKLGAIPLTLTPLRERSEDIGGLAEFFRTSFMEQYRRDAAPLSPAAVSRLMHYPWPGNVLELENLVRRYVAAGDEEQLLGELGARSRLAKSPRRRTLPAPTTETSLRAIGQRAAQEAELAAIMATLEQVQWNRAEAARLLRVSYKTLLNKLNRAGVPARTRTLQSP